MRALPRLLIGWLTTAAICLPGAARAGGASEKAAQAIRDSLPRYDPAQRANAERAREARRNTGDRSPVLNAPAPPLPAEPAVPAPPAADPQVVQLQPFTVHGRRDLPVVHLPRVAAPEALRPGENTADPYLTPGERRARLQKKHLSGLDRALNKFSLGTALPGSAGARAAGAEQRERFARGAGEVADALQLGAVAGEDEKALKELRELYLQLMTTRPK
ncbi:MAG: hypothetical protein KF715_15030 [Candidatus Didemnitutus sp.]|nr:hypothetical protein [Candidatus Didemnitutus sp.]